MRPRRSFLAAFACAAAVSALSCAPEPTSSEPNAPILLGFLNDEIGRLNFPELAAGSRAGVDYVNRALGGVKGRPLRVSYCASDGSPEKSIACANRFVEEGVVAVLEGLDTGAEAVLPILASAQLPLVGHIAASPGQETAENAYFFGAAPAVYGVAALKYYAGQGLRSAAFVTPDVPAARRYADTVLKPAATKLGIAYEPIYYDVQAPNWPTAVAAAMAKNPQVSGLYVGTDATCVSVLTAFRSAGYPGRLLAASCSAFAKALGAGAHGVETYSDLWKVTDVPAAPPAKQRELGTYLDAMKAAGQEAIAGGLAQWTFADTVNLSRVLATINGPIDGVSVSAALRSTKNLDGFLGPLLTCDHTVLKGQSSCGHSLLVYRVRPDGGQQAQTRDFVDVTGLVG
ncbi:ABC transporter substrate-binding protein [Amycolatopsis anabasis]|uniref:ABC transporter substrate-binding protein n=1 Tax=Amycolatopsis anabasis TaxID=1840409 RepID=UPI00131B7615|nr:ABC transporter substrate-binding protein [Amycolatopsis anabasis]